MVSKNRSLKVNMGLNKEDNAAYTAFRAAKYKPDIKYMSSLLQQRKSH